MENFLLHYGLPALFFLSLLAATLVPMGSEWLLLSLLFQGFSPVQVVVVATLGNVLGACITYGIGVWGSEFLMKKLLRVDEKQSTRAMALYQRYGPFSLLLSWLPVIGDPLCLAAGVLRLQPLLFLLPVVTGKLARYTFIALLAVAHI